MARYVYLHGWGVGPDGAKARFMREHLAPAEVLTFSWHVPSYSATTTTAALAEIERRLSGASWNVVGSSQGGYLAALLAQQRPELLLLNRIDFLAKRVLQLRPTINLVLRLIQVPLEFLVEIYHDRHPRITTSRFS